MKTTTGSYVIEGELDVGRLSKELGRRYVLEREPPREVRRAVLDSFDGRIAGAGRSLETEDRGDERRLIWRCAETGRIDGAIPIASTPKFASDVPAGRLREALTDVLDTRAVQSIVALGGKVRPYRVVNEDGKTVLRLERDDSYVLGAGRRKLRALAPRLRVIPVRGYTGARKRAVKAISGLPGLAPERASQVQEALETLGRRLGENPTKLRVGIEPDDTAIDGVRALLAALLKTLVANETGIVEDVDAEFLHDYRVAIRRMRTLLGEIRDVLPADRVALVRGELKWLGAITSAQRDLDVQLMSFAAYREMLPEPHGAALGPVEAHVRRRREAARRDLLAALKSDRYAALLDGIRKLIAEPAPAGAPPSRAFAPLRPIADRRIWKVYRGILKHGRRISAEGSPAALHELRKDLKRLRYMLEFFRSLHPGTDTAATLRLLRRLQNRLGRYQDYAVHIGALRAFGREMMEADTAGPETLMAIGVLVAELERRQDEARAAFADRFAEFDRKPHRALFKAVYAEPGEAAGR